MDKKTLGIVALSITATLLVLAYLVEPTPVLAEAVVTGRDYQAVTTRAQNGGDALYILDNKTGQLAVFMYDARDKTVHVRDVRYVRDAFAGR
jgi:hypothetical protein